MQSLISLLLLLNGSAAHAQTVRIPINTDTLQCSDHEQKVQLPYGVPATTTGSVMLVGAWMANCDPTALIRIAERNGGFLTAVFQVTPRTSCTPELNCDEGDWMNGTPPVCTGPTGRFLVTKSESVTMHFLEDRLGTTFVSGTAPPTTTENSCP